jgi:hypothetical protein
MAPTVTGFVTFGRSRDWRNSAAPTCDQKDQLVGIGGQVRQVFSVPTVLLVRAYN